ncbi:MAG: DUF3267 domain-containing protein [Bacteroidales bacterium]|nr:DUF3267 domain-containing protein [Bacteroidales bacterium]
MALLVEDLDDQNRFRQILAISYHDLVQFILDYIKRKSGMTIFFWSVCLIFLAIAVKERINIAGYFPIKKVLFHSVLGFVVFPVICIPVHELLHLIPYFFFGAKRLRIGMDLKQNLFYVTAHRYVTPPLQFKLVAVIPFLIISISVIFLVFTLPGLWKWSLSVLLFVHATMCAGDFALLNFYYLNRHKKIYTWDDVDQKIAYFYEKI